ncbi:hypothetical protein PQQ52_02415 [Paraburkholderia sediminicola]|uniref:hypothetical protein n=1 Tax=Paraburkholderia sediminicola TaxID=458836 RepID=UPI0038B7040F
MAENGNELAPIIQLGRAFAGWIEKNQPLLASIAIGVQGLASEFVGFANRLHSHFDARMEVYPELANCALSLAKRGWFMSGYFALSELDQLARQAASGTSLEDLETLLAKLYTEDLTHHLESIIAEHPARAFAIRPAVDAHLRSEYALSVPLFFAQAEGVCFENAKKYLFQGQSEERVAHVAQLELAALAAAPSDNPVMGFYSLLYEMMWTSVSERLPIAYNHKDRERFDYNGLNRNTVLHGIAMEEYATEENSLKAFSLLSCMAALMSKQQRAAQGASVQGDDASSSSAV